MNWLYALVLTASNILKQLMLLLLEHGYKSLESETVFYYWWLTQVFMDIGEIISKNKISKFEYLRCFFS